MPHDEGGGGIGCSGGKLTGGGMVLLLLLLLLLPLPLPLPLLNIRHKLRPLHHSPAPFAHFDTHNLFIRSKRDAARVFQRKSKT